MAVKYTLHVEGATAAELTDAVADLALAIGAGAGAANSEPAEDDTPPPAAPASKKGGRKGGKKQQPAEGEDEGPALTDVKEIAAELVQACGGDMERAQELVYAEWKVRRVSELDKGDYARFIEWAKEQIETLRELYDGSGGQQEGED